MYGCNDHRDREDENNHELQMEFGPQSETNSMLEYEDDPMEEREEWGRRWQQGC